MPHCIVVGGTSGIGAATAVLAARRGYDLTLVSRDPDSAGAVAVMEAISASGRQALAIPADVSREHDVERAFLAARKALGPPIAMVNSAGMAYHSRVDALDAVQLERLLAVNVVGTMLCCREAALCMSTSRGGGGGSIVNMSSMAATIGGRPGASAYAASKAAIDSFTTGFAREVATEGIRVNAVRPGVVDTEMTRHIAQDKDLLRRVANSIPMSRLGRPEEVAEISLWLLSDAASWVTGAHIDAGGGGFVYASLR